MHPFAGQKSAGSSIRSGPLFKVGDTSDSTGILGDYELQLPLVLHTQSFDEA